MDALTDPSSIQVDGHERRRYCEVVDEWVHLQHKPQFVAGGDELKIYKSCNYTWRAT